MRTCAVSIVVLRPCATLIDVVAAEGIARLGGRCDGRHVFASGGGYRFRAAAAALRVQRYGNGRGGIVICERLAVKNGRIGNRTFFIDVPIAVFKAPIGDGKGTAFIIVFIYINANGRAGGIEHHIAQ